MPKATMAHDIYEFGELIRNRRKLMGLTQADLAAAAHLSDTAIQRIENGQSQTTIESFFRIANALGVTPNDLTPSQYTYSLWGMREIADKVVRLNATDQQCFFKIVNIIADGLHSQST